MAKEIYQGTKEVLKKYKTREEVAKAAEEFFSLSKAKQLAKIKEISDAEGFLFLSHRTMSVEEFAKHKKDNAGKASCMAFMYNYAKSTYMNNHSVMLNMGCAICPLKGFEEDLKHLMPEGSWGICDPYYLDTRRPENEKEFNELFLPKNRKKSVMNEALGKFLEYDKQLMKLNVKNQRGEQHTVKAAWKNLKDHMSEGKDD